MNIKEIKELLQTTHVSAEQLELFAKDERSGVQQALRGYQRRLQKLEQAKQKQYELLSYERECLAKGYRHIAGVDEAGRGPLAGPLVVAAAILKPDCCLYGVDDSKKLSETKREQLYAEILQQVEAYSVRIIEPPQIDSLNIYQATLQGMSECLDELRPDVALIDAMPVKSQDYECISIIKGDALSLSIAAASIIAKVTRDRIMLGLDREYPEYGFAKHKGYPTQEHMQAITQYGILACHRTSYEPIKSMLGGH